MAAAFALAMGCGDDGSGGDGTPDGLYALEDENGCIVALSIERKTGIYATTLQCDFEDGGVGIEQEGGTYAVQGDRLAFMPNESSCADDDLEPYDVKFRIYANGDLFLADEGGGGELVKVNRRDLDGAGSSGRTFELGCWDGEDFTPK